MVTIILGLLTASFFASTSLMSSRSVKVIGSGSSLAWTMLAGLIITVPFAVVSGVPTNFGSSAPWMVAAGLGNVVGILLAGFALRVGKVGVVAPILATGGAISALISALLGESIAPLVAFLLLVIVGGIVLSAVAPDPAPAAGNPPGGLRAASGMRYFTFTVTNLDEVFDACSAAGAAVVLTPFAVAPSVRIAMVEDPDGNHVEFLERS